jgi:enediyne biosynthesis protein E4
MTLGRCLRAFGRPLGLMALLSSCGGEQVEPCPEPPAPVGAPFVDKTNELGIDFTHHLATDFCKLGDTVGGPGVCVFDFDADDDMDIYFVDRQGHPNALYRNDGGSFSEVAAMQGATLTDSDSMGCLAFDYDGDGDQDLYVTTNGEDKLLRNDNGQFTVAPASTIQATGFSVSASAGDIDGDGDLDLFVATVVDLESCPDQCSLFPAVCTATRNLLFINNDGVFDEQAVARGIDDEAPSLAPLLYDHDDDGDIDIYVGNDMGLLFSDRLYINDGTGYFENKAEERGFDAPGTDTMGVDVGDYDGDGMTDVLISDFKGRPIRLLHCFASDIGCSNEVLPDGLDYVKWGVGFVDFDHDRDLDAMISTGDVAHLDGSRTHLYFNDGSGQFREHRGGSVETTNTSRGLAFGDLDGDGDVDAVIANAGGGAEVLFNQAAAGHALTVQLDSLAAGAKVTVTAQGKSLAEHAILGGSYAGSSDPRLHFGLGASCRADVHVRYVNGAERRLMDVSAGTLRVTR